jgi:hypothetical protein
MIVIASGEMGRHCEPSGLAFGKPKDELREAVSVVVRDCFGVLYTPRNDGCG